MREGNEHPPATIGRREMEQRFLDGDFAHGRASFWASRAGYANRSKYAVALVATMISPRLYARAFSARDAVRTT